VNNPYELKSSTVKIHGKSGFIMYTTLDRRVKPRIKCDYLAVVEDPKGNGTKYQDQGKLVNLSASGLFMLVNREIEMGQTFFVTIHLVNSLNNTDAPRLATNGIVVRTEPRTADSCGIAIKFQNYRFL
jgi:hypothetical protein